MNKRLRPTRNDLPARVRAQMADLLNARLADGVDLVYQIKTAHWNVTGPSFIGLHEFFDKVYEEAVGWVDEIAERAVQLGAAAEGTVRLSAERSELAEFPHGLRRQEQVLRALADALAAFGVGVRAGVETADKAGDADTADMLTDVSRACDKALWMVESHLA